MGDVGTGTFVGKAEAVLAIISQLSDALSAFTQLVDFASPPPAFVAFAEEQGRRLHAARRIAENYPYAVADIRPLLDLSQDEDAVRWALTEAMRITPNGCDVLSCAHVLLLAGSV